MQLFNQPPKVAIITGGTMGIGRAAAEVFAAEGWAVGIIAREPKRVQEMENYLRAQDVPALGIVADVADADAVNAAADQFEEELGPIRVWVNNAMVSILSPVSEITSDEFKRVTEVTYLGAVYGTQAALRHMQPRNRGTIIQISSVLGMKPFPLQSAYAAAKGALTNFTDSLRGELLHEKSSIQLTTIYLPTVNTPQYENMVRNRMGHKQEAPPPVFSPYLCAKAILFAAEHNRREIWVGRTSLQVALLKTMPWLADRVAAKGWDAQLQDTELAETAGNLEAPLAGAIRVEGPFTEQSEPVRNEFWTSRQHGILLAGLAAGAATVGVLGTLGILRLLRTR